MMKPGLLFLVPVPEIRVPSVVPPAVRASSRPSVSKQRALVVRLVEILVLVLRKKTRQIFLQRFADLAPDLVRFASTVYDVVFCLLSQHAAHM